MKKSSTRAKIPKANAAAASYPAPPPLRKRPPKNNLGDVVKLFRAMGPDFRVPGRPAPRIRPPAAKQ